MLEQLFLAGRSINQLTGNLSRSEWMVIMVVVLVIGAYCLRGIR